ncbi:MAG: PEP-CTERM sorting domain-containing protein [Phycisphaerae bacterium]|nr:PEP-CTERM sorting domain-containing protein [Phycisphaerae bacterium]
MRVKHTTILAGALVMVLAFTSSAMGLTVDGDISDWGSAYRHTDAANDTGCSFEMLEWGAFSNGTTLYMFQRVDIDMTVGQVWSDFWCDIDNSDATTLGGIIPQSLYAEVGINGADISPQWDGGVVDPNANPWVHEPLAVQYFGYGDDWWKDDGINAPSAVMAYSADGTILEYSVSVAELEAKALTFPDEAVGGKVWEVATRLDGIIRGGSYGADVSDSTELLIVADYAGDADNDGDVDADDLATWGANYTGSSVGGAKGWANGDFDGDGDVDADDLATWGANYTGSGGAPMMADMMASVPEPMTMSLLAIGGIALIRRRRK